MSEMIQTIMTGGLLTLLTALLTYFVTSVVQRDTYIKVARELVNQHEKLWHQEVVRDVVNDHAKNCEAAIDLKTIRKVVMAMYAKQGGNIAELDL
jgi:predicted nucleic-acid-binding protein